MQEKKAPVILRSERRAEATPRRTGEDRRSMEDRRMGQPDRRIRKKFVLFDRRKGTGRRLLSKGRRYLPDRRAALRRKARA